MMAISRRQMLARASMGFGSLALSDLLVQDKCAAAGSSNKHPLAPRPPHFPAQARSIIFLYMDGGVSQVDTFDHKPLLYKLRGREPKFKIDPTVFNNHGKILPSQWKFKRYGQSGQEISDLFPHLGSVADDLCIIRSMSAPLPSHPNAVYGLHTGFPLRGRPSMGAWVSYGLGTENQNLPSYVVLHGGQVPSGGLANFRSGFLPANHQGSIFRPGGQAIRNIHPREATVSLQEKKLEYLKKFDQQFVDRVKASSEIEAAIENYELAFRMQVEVPDVIDLTGESQTTKRLYGLESPDKRTVSYGSQCLLARRLVERGVRFIELTIDKEPGVDRWDQHARLREGHEKNAHAVDQPIAGLIKDLKLRGLLDSTLIVFTGEFGRTPFAQGTNGRDHNPQGFSIWMAGGGTRGGVTYGATDEFGYRAVENKMTLHDMHANMLHVMGLDHERLTYHYSGRDYRLTDVGGRVIPEILV